MFIIYELNQSQNFIKNYIYCNSYNELLEAMKIYCNNHFEIWKVSQDDTMRLLRKE